MFGTNKQSIDAINQAGRVTLDYSTERPLCCWCGRPLRKATRLYFVVEAIAIAMFFSTLTAAWFYFG
jgi:hypothetical protein